MGRGGKTNSLIPPESAKHIVLHWHTEKVQWRKPWPGQQQLQLRPAVVWMGAICANASQL